MLRADPSSTRTYTVSVVASGVLLVLVAVSVTVGADSLWLVAMGDEIARQRAVPVGVPFAGADSSHWVNVTVLGQLVFAGVHALGPLGLPAFQLLVDAALLTVTALGARRLGASDLATGVVLLVMGLGLLTALGVVRAQLLSLVPFALLVLLLRSEHATPSRRIWLLVPLVAVWGNLHGAVLAGVSVAGCYLLLSRLRVEPVAAVAVGLATVVALWLTPAHLRTAAYYLGVLDNEAARRGSELWAPPKVSEPLDLLMLLTAVVLVLLCVRRRRPLWEYAALAGLSVATASSARHGLWLLLFAAGPAALTLTRMADRHPRPKGSTSRQRRVAALASVLVAVVTATMLGARAGDFRGDAAVISAVRNVAGHRTVLAPEPLSESLAAGGIRVWMSNPIDAFSHADQAAYLDFLSGQGPSAPRALSAADVVVARTGSDQAGLATRSGFAVRASLQGYEIMERP